MSRSETGADLLDFNPEVVELPMLMQRLRAGLLQVPRFKRGFIWGDSDCITLMQSVVLGIPIGSIFTWRTVQSVSVVDAIGPHRIPSPSEVSRRHAPSYVLDGHQRLTALFSALVRPPHDEDLSRWTLYADLRQAPDPGGYRFVFHRTHRMLPELYFPLHTFFDDNAYLRFIRSIRGIDDRETESFVERANHLVARFRRYRVLIVPLVTEDVSLVARAFVLVNQAGTGMTETDLVNVLFQGSDLDRDFAKLREEHLAPVGWGGLQDQWILDACKVASDIRLGRSDPEEIVNAFHQTPTLLQDVGARLVAVAGFLKAECEIPAPRLLPYEQFAALMTEFFRLRPDPDAAQRKLLRRWFWLSVYQIATTSFTFTAVKNALAMVREVASAENPVLETIDEIDAPPAIIVTRGARARALGLLLWRQRPLRSDGTPLSGLTEFGEERGLFAVATGNDWGEDDETRSQIGNRILAEKRDLAALRRRLKDDRDALDDAFLRSHAMPREALHALRAGDAATFARLRTEHICRMELAFLEEEGVYAPPPGAPLPPT